jgi:hypothetical protein
VKSINPEALVKELAHTTHVARHDNIIGDLVRAGRPEELLGLAFALEEHGPAFGVRTWELQHVFDRIEFALAMSPGLANAAVLMRVLLIPRKATIQIPSTVALRQRRIASWLGSGQSAESFLALAKRHLGEPQHLELFLCWAQELVVRGESLAGQSVATDLWKRATAAQHGLSILPLQLDPLEIALRASVPNYHERTGGFAPVEPLRRPRLRLVSDRSLPGSVSKTKKEDPPAAEAIRAAVKNWVDASNGTTEATVIAFSRRVLEGEIDARFLCALELACLEGATEADVQVSATSPEHAVTELFSAAANGGAYSGGLDGAYGRLETWRSIGALSGASFEAPFADRADRARRTVWFDVNAGTKWFHHVAWDIALAALRPGGESMAFLAATDRD